MLRFKTAALGFALLACAGVARTTLAAEAMMSDSDNKMMSSCMAMSSEAMMKDAGCVSMEKMHPSMSKPAQMNK